jgi:hypothetical protein
MGLFSCTINNIISNALLPTGTSEVDWRRLKKSRLHLRWLSFTCLLQINSTYLISRVTGDVKQNFTWTITALIRI